MKSKNESEDGIMRLKFPTKQKTFKHIFEWFDTINKDGVTLELVQQQQQQKRDPWENKCCLSELKKLKQLFFSNKIFRRALIFFQDFILAHPQTHIYIYFCSHFDTSTI